ncbi:MAG: ribosomal-protein-alanine N-acetyltransferase [Lachnospiraceae bacterium]|nr:ribosomal-protein-alanine N-acetyltransferase [Lachnospiraceae bacterium]
MIIRKMTFEDAQAVALIEKDNFSEPWSEESLNDFLKHDYSHFFVAEKDDRIIGYIGAYIAGDGMDITNVAVDKNERNQGIGGKLIDSVFECAKAHNCPVVNLEVRESNLSAIGLYEKKGFKSLGIRKNFYSKPVESAIIYQYEICEI